MSPLNDSGCTPNYAAPEVRLGLSYSYGIDFWSFGATLHWVFTGKVSLTFAAIHSIVVLIYAFILL